MPNGIIHKKLYEELIRLKPHLKYDPQIFSDAIDSHDITAKATTHRSFFKFKLTYHIIEKRSGRFGTSTDESLRYLWVNHLVADFVYNKNLYVFRNEKSPRFPLWKIIAQLDPKYLKYGFELARRLGMKKEDLRILKTQIRENEIFSTPKSLARWRATAPHYSYRLIGDPANRRLE